VTVVCAKVQRCEAALKGVIAKLVCEKAAAEQQHLCQAAQLKGQVHDRKRALLASPLLMYHVFAAVEPCSWQRQTCIMHTAPRQSVALQVMHSLLRSFHSWTVTSCTPPFPPPPCPPRQRPLPSCKCNVLHMIASSPRVQLYVGARSLYVGLLFCVPAYSSCFAHTVHIQFTQQQYMLFCDLWFVRLAD